MEKFRCFKSTFLGHNILLLIHQTVQSGKVLNLGLLDVSE